MIPQFCSEHLNGFRSDWISEEKDLIWPVQHKERGEIKGKLHALDTHGLFSEVDELPCLVSADVCTSQLLEVKKIFVLSFKVC